MPEPRTFRVQGPPKAQPRPRAYSPKPGLIRIYDCGSARAWKEAVALAAKPHLPPKPLVGPVRVDIDFFFHRPTRLMRRMDPDGLLPHTAKPDIDNLGKAVLDALKDAGMFCDDSIVFCGFLVKWYCTRTGEPGALVRVYPDVDWQALAVAVAAEGGEG